MNGKRVSGSEKGSKNKNPAAFVIYRKENVLKVSTRIFNLLFMDDDMCTVLMDRTQYKTKGNNEIKTCQQI